MTSHNRVPISVAQNSARAQRLLAAQSRLYTDAKQIHDVRIMIVVILAVATIVLALAVPSARTAVGATGGAISFLWSVLASGREKRCRRQASFIQEDFDTHVFDLPWKDLAAERPSPTLIAEAAARYRGNRTADWYPDTENVVRPLDIMICQRSNLGWGSSMHRFYAAILTASLVLIIMGGAAVCFIANLSVADGLTAVLVPLLAPARELIDLIRAHRESDDAKTKIESKILDLWSQVLQGAHELNIADCRDIQDCILAIRQNNAHIPDWLDQMRRNSHEAAMQTSARHLIEQAVQHGKTR